MLNTLRLIDAFLTKIDTQSPVFTSRDGKLCISGFSAITKSICFYIKTDLFYVDDMFAVRNWKSLSTILHSLPEENSSVVLEKNKEGYPYRFVFKNGRTKITYYVQTKQIISDEYKSFSFEIENPKSYQDLPTFDSDMIKSFLTATKITMTDSFALQRRDAELFAIFGDTSLSVDNVEVKLLDNCKFVDIPPIKLYNTLELINLIKSADNHKICMIKNDKLELTSSGEKFGIKYNAGFIFSSKTRI